MATQPGRNIDVFRQNHRHAEDEHCPLCDQPLPHDLTANELRARLRQQEQDQAQRMRVEFAKELTAKIDHTRKEVESKAAEREKTVRTEATAEATTALKSEVAKAELAKSKAEQEKRAAQNHVKELKAAQEQRIELEIRKALTEQREALEQDKDKAIRKAQADEFKKAQKLEKQVDLLKRQLEQKTAEARGEGAEIDLYESLRENFDDDKITRIKKGQPGADILHEVRHNGQICGSIIYDSKNHAGWRDSFVDKLKTDQLAARADHAVLTTSAFPAGARQLQVKDEVILLNPARAVELVRIVREHIIQTNRLRLSGKEKDRKTAALYEFMNSDRCRQLMARYEAITDELLDIDVNEVKAHDLVWKKRGQFLRDAQKVHNDYRAEIDRIVEDGSLS